MKRLIILLALVAVFLLDAPLQAEIYSWTDADGVKRFTNIPPPASVAAKRQSEIPYDAKADAQRREAERAYWQQQLAAEHHRELSEQLAQSRRREAELQQIAQQALDAASKANQRLAQERHYHPVYFYPALRHHPRRPHPGTTPFRGFRSQRGFESHSRSHMSLAVR
jgi:hypothetical protein